MKVPAQIFGKDVLSASELWDFYSRVANSAKIWRTETFASSAKACGLKRIAFRQGYFSFSGPANLTGQAPITTGFIEEIRLIISKPPNEISEADWDAESPKLALLGSDYARLFCENLGAARTAHRNEIFEYHQHRVRVLTTHFVYVVISNLEIVAQLPNDWWAPPTES